MTRQIVLIGGGHAHALVLRAWGLRPPGGVGLTVIDPASRAAYSGMLPGLVAGHYTRNQLEIDLARLARHAGARLVTGHAEGIDRVAQTVHVQGAPPIPYDIASLDIGITSRMPQLPGFADHAVPAKPLGAFAAAWEGFVARVHDGAVLPRVAVIGAGVAGVELALAACHRLTRAGLAPEVTLIDAGAEALRDVRPAPRKVLIRALAKQGIAVRTGATVVRIEAGRICLKGGQTIAAGLVIGAAGAQPQGWLRDTGLHLTNGFVTVDRHLRSVTDPRIFAVGDCAHLSHAPRPKAGVYAVRAAPVLLENLRAALSDGPLRPYRPQRDYLKLVSMGARRAVADRVNLPIAGAWVWRWKDRIDRRFMAQFHDLPDR